MYDQSKLFGRPGYIPLKEYIADIDDMISNGPWKVPFRMVDHLQFQLLKGVSKFSWFADALHITHNSSLSPAYAMLFAYARRRGFADSAAEKRLQHSRGYFAYYLNRKVSVVGREDVMIGQGVAQNRATAFSKALGEMIERAIAGAYDANPDRTIASPQTMLSRGVSIVYPPKYHRFLSLQREKFKGLRHDPLVPIEWVEGKSLVTNKQVFIPRKMTSWFIANSQRKNIFVQATTNGAAGYFTKVGATLRGLLEVIQRDGFLVHWLTQIPPRVIRHDTLPDDLFDQVCKIESGGVSVHILDVTSLSVPSIIIALTNDRSAEASQVVLSGASALTFHEAIENALREIMIGMEMFYYPQSGSGAGLEKDNPEAFISRLGKIERQLYWRGVERVERFRWFVSGEKVSYQDICAQYDANGMKGDAERLQRCINTLKTLGDDYCPTVYFPKNSAQKEIGYYIAQVFVPKAFPFYLLEYMGTFESDRLDDFARGRGVSEWVLNPLPHMFS